MGIYQCCSAHSLMTATWQCTRQSVSCSYHFFRSQYHLQELNCNSHLKVGIIIFQFINNYTVGNTHQSCDCGEVRRHLSKDCKVLQIPQLKWSVFNYDKEVLPDIMNTETQDMSKSYNRLKCKDRKIQTLLCQESGEDLFKTLHLC